MEEYSPLRWQIGSVTLKRTKALQRSPGETTDAIKKNLFCSEEDALELSSNQTQCSATSEYFSQSSMELSYGLDESRTSKRLFESPSQVFLALAFPGTGVCPASTQCGVFVPLLVLYGAAMAFCYALCTV